MQEGGISKTLAIAYELGKPIAIFIILLLLVHFFIATIFIIDGESMEPNFHSGQLVAVNKLAYLTSSPMRGDVVVLRFPGDPKRSKYIKRIIGMPNDKIEIRQGSIYINNKRLLETYIDDTVDTQTDNIQVKVLDDDEYFLIGDNRAGSSDSRIWGSARKEDLIGRTRFILFPFNTFGYITNAYYN